ncbi:MAG TPA: response regulator [Rhizomicrobium sp.]|nr:response regulator [Rhizomicrobium sp.]
MSQVILAEDEAQLRQLIATLLIGKGISVSEAADGIEALQLLKDNPGAALLLSDVKMPNMNGYDLVEASLKLRPELKILMMTAYAADRPTPAALQAREIRTLVKPFDPDRMCDLVLDMLARP